VVGIRLKTMMMEEIYNNRKYYNMSDILNADNYTGLKKDGYDFSIQTDTEKSGWGFLGPEINFFLVDFCREQLTAMEKLIFYGYYINGMTMKELAERLYGREHEQQFVSEEECNEDDKICKTDFHASHQAVYNQIKKIQQKLRYSWKYMDRWNDTIVTKRTNKKKVK